MTIYDYKPRSITIVWPGKYIMCDTYTTTNTSAQYWHYTQNGYGRKCFFFSLVKQQLVRLFFLVRCCILSLARLPLYTYSTSKHQTWSPKYWSLFVLLLSSAMLLPDCSCWKIRRRAHWYGHSWMGELDFLLWILPEWNSAWVSEVFASAMKTYAQVNSSKHSSLAGKANWIAPTMLFHQTPHRGKQTP